MPLASVFCRIFGGKIQVTKPEDLVNDLITLRKGAGLTIAKLRGLPGLLASLGAESPVDAMEELKRRLTELGESREAQAARNAYGLGPSKSAGVTARRGDLAVHLQVHPDTVEGWENTGIRELAEVLSHEAVVLQLVRKPSIVPEPTINDDRGEMRHRYFKRHYLVVWRQILTVRDEVTAGFREGEGHAIHTSRDAVYTASRDQPFQRDVVFYEGKAIDAYGVGSSSLKVEFIKEDPASVRAFGPADSLVEYSIGTTPALSLDRSHRVEAPQDASNDEYEGDHFYYTLEIDEPVPGALYWIEWAWPDADSAILKAVPEG